MSPAPFDAKGATRPRPPRDPRPLRRYDPRPSDVVRLEPDVTDVAPRAPPTLRREPCAVSPCHPKVSLDVRSATKIDATPADADRHARDDRPPRDPARPHMADHEALYAAALLA